MINLNNTKVRISSPEESEAVQKKAFELGWRWRSSETNVSHTDRKSLFFYEDKDICYSLLSNEREESNYFKSHHFKEITVRDILIPEKWYIKLSNDNRSIVNLWLNSVDKTDHYENEGNYAYCEPMDDRKWKYVLDTPKRGYTEISIDLFTKYILNQTQKMDQYLTRRQLINLRYSSDCNKWVETIDSYLKENWRVADDTKIAIKSEDIELAEKECTPSQKQTLRDVGINLEKEEVFFGEVVARHNGEVLLKSNAKGNGIILYGDYEWEIQDLGRGCSKLLKAKRK